MENKRACVPFYQALSALTGSGKTPILADAVSQIRAMLPSAPIVLWVSKARAVVDQTFANFEPGGKYHHLVDAFQLCYLSELRHELISDESTSVIACATVGSFNQRARSDGTLRVHSIAEDDASVSLWTALKERTGSSGIRRSLIIVYDEAHNLSDQQTDLLIELEPDAILVASATMRTPGRLGRLIARLREYGWNENEFITSVPSSLVVDAGLIKRQLVLGGYSTQMETALDDMFDSFEAVRAKALNLGAGFQPKAIYVCRTNISQDDGTPDNPSRPFLERRAPPILIWRHLVEKKGVNPAEIAVYADLKFLRRENPPPADFVLFSGGEEDFAAFRAGNFRHVIFNLSLQEGWDDPECCFAYVDKSMGSAIQVEQVIGRVLRQPGARHYDDPDMNSANFFIRVDSKQAFTQILDDVRRRVSANVPDIRLASYANRAERARVNRAPKSERTVPEIHIDADDAVSPLSSVVSRIIDYRNDVGGNSIGKGESLTATQTIGSSDLPEVYSIERPHSNRVTARWVVRREVQSLYPEVLKTVDWTAPKFDALVEITSPAAHSLRNAAIELVDTFLENSRLAFEEENPFRVSSVHVDPGRMELFSNALHEGYSDLNPDELVYARAIDGLGFPWTRNPVNGGFRIPLLEKGDRRNFYPDFLLWRDGLVFALDPKGEHLLARDSGIKLLDIRDESKARRVVVRLFTKGKWKDQANRLSKDGHTVWLLRSGKLHGRHFSALTDAVDFAVEI